jgi:predicted O-methyltransferase YrrM
MQRSTLRYPARYIRALTQIRWARTLARDANFEEAFAFADEVGITQQPEEIGWLFELVQAKRPRHLLEIGLDEGGTLLLWTRAAASDAHLISIDTRPPGPLGIYSPFPLVRRCFAHSHQRIDLLLAADSHDNTTQARVEKILRGAGLDFLFIDGDHSRDGVWQDFRMYSPLVRPGGIVAFHDVSQAPAPSTEGVAAFWHEFRAKHETEECVVGREPGFGIGIWRVPG